MPLQANSALHMAVKDIINAAESPDRLPRSKRCCATLLTASTRWENSSMKRTTTNCFYLRTPC